MDFNQAMIFSRFINSIIRGLNWKPERFYQMRSSTEILNLLQTIQHHNHHVYYPSPNSKCRIIISMFGLLAYSSNVVIQDQQ